MILETEAGQPLAMRAGHLTYLGAWLDEPALKSELKAALTETGVETFDMPGGLRRRMAGKTEFLINYDPEPRLWDGLTLPAAGVIWR